MSEVQRSEILEGLGTDLSERLAAVRPTCAMNYVANFTPLQTLMDHVEAVSTRLEIEQGGRREATIELLELALEKDPELWVAHLVLAFYDATYRDDFRAGGERLAVAARMSRSPIYVTSLARRMLERAGVDADSVVDKSVACELLDNQLTERERKRRAELAFARQRFMNKVEPWVPETFEAPQMEEPSGSENQT